MTVRARYAEWCAVCGDLIPINAPLARWRGKWIHPNCGPGGDE